MTDINQLRRAAIEGPDRDKALAVYADALAARYTPHEVIREYHTVLLLRTFRERDLLEGIDTLGRAFRGQKMPADWDIRLMLALKSAIKLAKDAAEDLDPAALYAVTLMWKGDSDSGVLLSADRWTGAGPWMLQTSVDKAVWHSTGTIVRANITLQPEGRSAAEEISYRTRLLGTQWTWAAHREAMQMLHQEPGVLEEEGFTILDEAEIWEFRGRLTIPGPLQLPRWA